MIDHSMTLLVAFFVYRITYYMHTTSLFVAAYIYVLEKTKDTLMSIAKLFERCALRESTS